tara:strand:- start:831 stop:1067 length:237 start_codon:yes stop_codon:yes gene_type:complete
MSSNVSNLQLLNNTEHRLKFRTGDKNKNSDISDVKDAIVGEIFLLNRASAGGHPALYVCVNTQGEIKKIHQFTVSDLI